MRFIALTALAVILAGGKALTQPATNAPVSTMTNTTPTFTTASSTKATNTPAIEADKKAWSFALSAYTYIVPDSREYVQPTFTVDRGGLHLEARYNYEDLDTGSAWVGYNFSFGEKLALELTPMLGGVFGNTSGIAPGYKFSLAYWKLELVSEGEYLVNTRDSAASFFYNWSELSVSPVDWFRVGVAVQRTKLYQSDFDVQRGFLVGFTYKKVSSTAYLFNPDASRPTLVLAVALSF
jgi:hypothetical protein